MKTRILGASILCLAVWLGPGPVSARLPADAPALPPPDPGTFTIVEVDTVNDLAMACWNLTSNQAIVIAPGSYDLSAHSMPAGDGRLSVGRHDQPLISNVQIRGATGDPADVVISGAGMGSSVVPFGFQIATASDVLIADLSIGSVYYHAVTIESSSGAARVTLHHTRLFDAGQQIVKGNPGVGGGAEDVVIEYSELFYSAGVPDHAELGYCYTNAIDAHTGQRWQIRDNLIRNIYCQNNLELAGPAILMWNGSADTVVERNTIIDSARGISLGLGSGADHSGGVVRNNFIRWPAAPPYPVDAPIYTTSAGSTIVHNTVLTNGSYYAAVEVRYSSTTDVEVHGNLLDALVVLREGASASLTDNVLAADPAWFADEGAGDLHLNAGAGSVIDQIAVHADCSDDFDGAPRPTSAVDLGADERADIFADGFESGHSGRWS